MPCEYFYSGFDQKLKKIYVPMCFSRLCPEKKRSLYPANKGPSSSYTHLFPEPCLLDRMDWKMCPPVPPHRWPLNVFTLEPRSVVSCKNDRSSIAWMRVQGHENSPSVHSTGSGSFIAHAWHLTSASTSDPVKSYTSWPNFPVFPLICWGLYLPPGPKRFWGGTVGSVWYKLLLSVYPMTASWKSLWPGPQRISPYRRRANERTPSVVRIHWKVLVWEWQMGT